MLSHLAVLGYLLSGSHLSSSGKGELLHLSAHYLEVEIHIEPKLGIQFQEFKETLWSSGSQVKYKQQLSFMYCDAFVETPPLNPDLPIVSKTNGGVGAYQTVFQ